MFSLLALSSIAEPPLPQIYVNSIDAEVFDGFSTTTTAPFISFATKSNIVVALVTLPPLNIMDIPAQPDFDACSQTPGCGELTASLTPVELSDAELQAQQALNSVKI